MAKVALVYNQKPSPAPAGAPEDAYSEWDRAETIHAIAEALRALGREVVLTEAGPALVATLTRAPVELVFNIAEGSVQASREAQVPALLDFLKIPYTGSGVLTMALALNKAMTKRVLMSLGIPTPKFQLFHAPDDPLDARLVFPLIVKPNREGSAKGITIDSVVQDELDLRQQAARIIAQYQQEALVEEFIDGRELTIGVLGSGPAARALPVLELDFAPCAPSGEYFYSWRVKEFQGNEQLFLAPRLLCPAPLEPEVTTAIQAVAVTVHRAMGCQDFSRVDIRLSTEGIPYVLEVNPLPGLDPTDSNLPYMARQAGMTYVELIKAVVESAVARHRASQPAPAMAVDMTAMMPELVPVPVEPNPRSADGE